MLTGGRGRPDIRIAWATVTAVVASARRTRDEPDVRAERREIAILADWLAARRALAAITSARLDDHVAALGMPMHHVSHPGPDWIRRRVPGGALTLGFGYGEPADRRPLPAGVLEHAGLDGAAAWPGAMSRLEELGAEAALRDRRHRDRPLTPMAGADVVTLLGSRSLRRELVAGENDGLAALIVPLRTRGWRANSVSDPAYGPALAAAMPADERGFDRPLLVTADEVTEVRPGGNPMRLLRGYDTA